MNLKKWSVPLFIFLLLLVLALQFGYRASAQENSLTIDWWTLPAGSGTATDGAYTLHGSSGQAAAGSLGNGTYRLDAGFWAGTGEAEYELFLPVIAQ